MTGEERSTGDIVSSSFNPSTTLQLVSEKGTVRGIRNRVRSSIFQQHCAGKELTTRRGDETNKVVVYVTSVSIVRETYERCRIVTKILQNNMIRYELRDVSLHKQYLKELSERLGVEDPSIPQVFAGGLWLGDSAKIQSLNETGELVLMLDSYPKLEKVSFYCEDCGGYRYTLCQVCKGSKKSAKVDSALATLKCTSCDKKGLVRCQACKEQQE